MLVEALRAENVVALLAEILDLVGARRVLDELRPPRVFDTMISAATTRPLPEACGNSRCEMLPFRFSASRLRTPVCASCGNTPMMRLMVR